MSTREKGTPYRYNSFQILICDEKADLRQCHEEMVTKGWALTEKINFSKFKLRYEINVILSKNF